MKIGIPLISHKSSVASDGFTIVELIVAAVLFALAASMAGLLVGVSNRSTIRTEQLANSSAAIESDIAKILDLSSRYTCCDGVCKINPTSTTKCEGAPGDSSYYFPQETADIATFEGLCTATSAGGSLTNNIIALINGLDQPNGVVRAAAVNDNPSDITAHLIRIRFSSSDLGVDRVFKFVPTVSGWCP